MKDYTLPLNILIADDHQLIIDGLVTILEGERGVGKISTVNNGQQAVTIAIAEEIDCVIMDINMPLLNGLEATRLIKKEKPFVKIIVVSMQCDATIVHKMFKAGADAFINKDTGKSELLKAIEKVMKNEKYISPELSQHLITNVSERKSALNNDEKQLTPREIEIIGLIAEGYTNADIAARLFLSTVTVDTHRKNMLAKLRLKNSAALVKYAADHKLI